MFDLLLCFNWLESQSKLDVNSFIFYRRLYASAAVFANIIQTKIVINILKNLMSTETLNANALPKTFRKGIERMSKKLLQEI